MTGTGKGGVITKADIAEAIEQTAAAARHAASSDPRYLNPGRIEMRNRILALALMLAVSAVALNAQQVLTLGRGIVGDLVMTRGAGVIVVTSGAGAPTRGGAGTEAGNAGPGSIYIDITNFRLYTNTNTQASPTWSEMPNAAVAFGFDDDVSLELGTSDDVGLRLRSTTLAADTALTDIIEGTPVGEALAANSLIIGNIHRRR